MRHLLLVVLLAGCAGSPYARRKAEEKAREAERADWAEAAKADTVEGWMAYRNKHPESRNRFRAYERAQQLAYEQAKRIGTAEAYEEYLRIFRTGKEANEIRAALEALRFTEAEAAGTPSAYRRFAETHPKSEKAGEAVARADMLALFADLEPAKTYSVEIAVDGPEDRRLNGQLSLRHSIEVVLGAAGLAPVESGQPDVVVRIDARLRWVGQTYGYGGIANKRYRVKDAGATLEGKTTVSSANGQRSREFRTEAKPPRTIQVSKGKVTLLGPRGDEAVFRRPEPVNEVCWVVGRVFGAEPLVSACAQEPRLLSACEIGLWGLDRKAILVKLDELARHAATKGEREAAGKLARAVREWRR